MPRLMVVDDDEFICRGLAQCIDWQSIGIDQVDTAFDGELALEKMKDAPADVMLVDLCMPFMDGLELAYNVMQSYPKTKLIILSAYKDFEYAQEAIRMNVMEYLTKPFEDQDVLAAVKRALEIIKENELNERRIRESRKLVREKLLMEWVTQGLTDKNASAVEELLNLGDHSHCYCVGILFVRALTGAQGEESIYDDESAVQRMCTLLSRQEFPESIRFFAQNDKIVFVYEGTDAEQADPVLAGWGNFLMRETFASIPCFTAFGMGNVYWGAERAALSYQEARRTGLHLLEYGNNAVIRINSSGESEWAESVCMQDYRHRIARATAACDQKAAEAEISAFFVSLDEGHIQSVTRIRLIAVELIIHIYHYICDQEQFDRLMGQLTQQFERLQKTLLIEQIKLWLIQAVGEIIDYLCVKRESYASILLSSACEYILGHYRDPCLSLVEVARNANVSTSYLSLLFRDSDKMGYSAYLTQVRLNKAKLLLCDPKVRLFEIAFMVGFNSQQYFSATFKKHEGCTPSEYRKNMLDRG